MKSSSVILLRVARLARTAALVFAIGSSRDLTSPLDSTLRCLIPLLLIITIITKSLGFHTQVPNSHHHKVSWISLSIGKHINTP